MLARVSLLFSFFCSFALFGQQFGGFKPSKMWLSLNKDNYSIIYSPENKRIALETASIIDQLNQKKYNIGPLRKEIDLVLQNSTTISNGYVSIAPFISEFFLTPPANSNLIGSLPWHYLLGIHEYQHVLQLTNTYSGWSKISYWLGGEFFWGSAIGLSVPNWFLEGDAVRAETEYTQQGRGRTPHFFNAFRAYAVKDSIPNYQRIRSGSIRNFVPNHYPLGYLMVSYGKERYGEELWTNVLKQTFRLRNLLYPFSSALKQNTGMRSRHFYQASLKDLFKKWGKEKVRTENIHSLSPLKAPKKSVNNYRFPVFINDSTLLFYHDSYDKVGRYYEYQKGELKTHKALGIRVEDYFSNHKNLIASTQVFFDPRWTWNDYSDVIIYDLDTDKSKRVTHQQKYFQPAFSAKGDQLVVHEVPKNGKYGLIILNTETGDPIKAIPNQKGYFFTYPQWLNDSTIIASTRDSLGQMALTKTSIQTGKTVNLSPWSFHLLGRPQIKEDKIFFSASYSGIDNLFRLNLSDQSIDQLTEGGPGRYQITAHPSKDSIVFNAFSLNGFELQSMPITNKNANRLEEITPLKDIAYYKKSFFDSTEIILPTLDSTSISVGEYKKSKSLFNFHSWASNFNSPIYTLRLLSDNILNNFNLSLGVQYNTNEDGFGYTTALSYSQYFTHIDGFFKHLNRRSKLRDGTEVDWNEIDIDVGLSLPLQLSSNLFSRRLNLFTYYDYIAANFDSERFNNLELHGTHLGFSYRQSRLKARKNIFTHLGLFASLSQKNAINENDVSQTLIQTALALPTLFANHSLILEGDAQLRRGRDTYQYSDQFVYSRGFNTPNYEEIYRGSINYHFPLLYPDRGAFGIVFLQRIRGNFFFDYSIDNRSKEFTSIGSELIFDLKLLYQFNANIGLRYVHLLTNENLGKSEEQSLFEVFIPIRRF